ncbi:hypothetical protein [Rhodopseudomonas sp. AAP120]|jgi:hypothetical protein|uniref:hypothetical protein n=1 Tax=Rhodopseudomonas sp. AAP120 TaxID=1523430 RepID=UPI000B2E181C|nr:hypothetical protein [Rhodopseudomonas sp. AAP120]MBX9829523.1 hypothetical protein [Xanthobacteraceae bacterium]
MASDLTFFQTVINDVVFRGELGSAGPLISARPIGKPQRHTAPLGSSAIFCHQRRANPESEDWWICEGAPPSERILLAGFSRGDLQRLSRRFGLPVRPEGPPPFPQFLKSAAFDGLKSWVSFHPKKAANWAHCHSELDWYAEVRRQMSRAA